MKSKKSCCFYGGDINLKTVTGKKQRSIVLEDKRHNALTVSLNEIWVTWERKGSDPGMRELRKEKDQVSVSVHMGVGGFWLTSR